jgi:hypothetical protein
MTTIDLPSSASALPSSPSALANSAGVVPNPAADPSKGTEPSAPTSAVPSGSANNAGHRLQQILREADTTIEKYAAYAGVTLRPAHGPIGRSINANAVYNKLVADGAYDPQVAAEARNFLADMTSIGTPANLNFNLLTPPTADDPKGVPLNQGNTKFDPELVKAVQETRRNEQATPRGSTNNSEPLWEINSHPASGVAPTEQQKASRSPEANADLPTLAPGATPPADRKLWGDKPDSSPTQNDNKPLW